MSKADRAKLILGLKAWMLEPGESFTDRKSRDGYIEELADCIISALATIPPPVADREAVARIIDPGTWHDRDAYVRLMTTNGGCALETVNAIADKRVRDSLAKADQILALSQPTVQPETGAGGADPSDLAGAIANLKAQFEGIAAHSPNDQPHYPDGVRPFGTGDLCHFIDILARAHEILSLLPSATTPSDLVSREDAAKVAEARRKYFVVGPDVRQDVTFSATEAGAAIRAMPISSDSGDLG